MSSKKSKFQLCEEIYAELVTTTEKLPAKERAKVVDAFVRRAGVKPASGNVYFSLIRNSDNTPPAPAPEPIAPPPVESTNTVTPLKTTEEVTASLSSMYDYADDSYDVDSDDADSIINEAFH